MEENRKKNAPIRRSLRTVKHNPRYMCDASIQFIVKPNDTVTDKTSSISTSVVCTTAVKEHAIPKAPVENSVVSTPDVLNL